MTLYSVSDNFSTKSPCGKAGAKFVWQFASVIFDCEFIFS